MNVDRRAVLGTTLVGALAALALAARPDPAPLASRVVRLEGAVVRPGWYEADVLGAAVGRAGGGMAALSGQVADGDTVRLYAGWGLVERPPPEVRVEVEVLPVNVNRASLGELDGLPGIGPVLAERIVAGRPYRRLTDLDRVKGIGPGKLAGLRGRVRF